MPSNAQIILNQILKQSKAKAAPDLEESAYFELFVAEEVLKNFDLSNDELEVGLMGQGNDGGIDAMYTFVNGKLLLEDSDLSLYKKGVTLDVFIMQSKKSNGFEGPALDKFIATTNDILDLSKPLFSLKSVYHGKLVQAVECFRKAHEELASKFPKLRISYIYASMGEAQQVHPNVQRKVEALNLTVTGHFPDCEFRFSFLGARELLEMARKIPSTTFQVNLIDSIATGNEAYLCLINLREYYKLITDEDNNLRKNIFEANVRDYQGKVEVNQGIKDTLSSNNPEDFWWLNNGITIIATKASIAGKTITLEDPQIVNGLQTSTEIFEYFKTQPRTQEIRSVLVRIVVTNSPASQDKIIRATNSQTAIPLASLKATDKVQRDIEDFFRSNDLYYDRRKNFYKNQGHPKDKIISIPYLAQAIMSIVLREPNEARARPSSILKRDSTYKQIFNPLYPMGLYLNCVKIMKIVDNYIRIDRGFQYSWEEGTLFPKHYIKKIFLSPEEKNNLRFHFAMYLTLSKIGRADYKSDDVAQINPNDLDESLLYNCLYQTVASFRDYRYFNSAMTPDTVGKSKEFVNFLLANFSLEQKGQTPEHIGPRYL